MSFSETVLDIDHILLQHFNSYPSLDGIMVFITTIGDVFLWLAIIALLYLWKGGKTAGSYVIVLFMVTLLELGLKVYIMRERPDPDDFRVLVHTVSYSMPSGHAARSFASAMFLHPLAGNLKIGLWLMAILVSISRLFVGVHYPSDVIAGALLGCAVGLLGIYVQKKYAR